MNRSTVRLLDFKAVDDLAFAAARGVLNVEKFDFSFIGKQLGPILELYQLYAAGVGPPSMRGGWLDVSSFAGLGRAIVSESSRWTSQAERSLGVLKTGRETIEQDWVAFAIEAKRAAIGAGLSSDWSSQMIAAMGEFRSNIIEHSGVQDSGIVAFHALPGVFEFVVSDRGVGLLATLREAPEYRKLDDHSEALRLALTDGASRFGFDHGRGYGFRPLFTGLANRQAALRFRTGNASLVIDGASPSLARAQFGRKAHMTGFFISVACQGLIA
ncbi:hypothetical protein [Inquilinus sp. CA228]|uniref:hypothetical protein n=1 Tax=Inquilinus sp. CA228 TaxID=3455609 RepID=UPI003F8D87EB